MKCIINGQLLGYLEEHQLINDRQYGFQFGGRSSAAVPVGSVSVTMLKRRLLMSCVVLLQWRCASSDTLTTTKAMRFDYPVARRDETVEDDYFGTKVSQRSRIEYRLGRFRTESASFLF
ncbi:hypothetical protein EVAR_55247_1 [Eumeta japonica]|uniref:Uncharacterized protein n=1 Tax=Eumeta variegata TaxID=151549 RepID=A0A4C1Y6C2_EUMVA|nr:hypothetical protein EVAR_55247_1 [Eumeta japonica]